MEQDDDALTEVPVYQMRGPDADLYGRLRLGLGDFARVEQSGSMILQLAADVDRNSAIIMALYESALVTYVRGFHSCRSVGLMSERTIFDAVGQGALDVHRYYVDMRNQHIAHNDSEYEAALVGVMVPLEDDMHDLGVVAIDVRRMFDEPESIRQLMSLASGLADHLRSLEEEAAEAVRERAREIGIDELRRVGPMQWTAPGPKVTGAPPREN